MSKSVNKIILIGNVGKDPEHRISTNQISMCNFSLATGEDWLDKESGEKKDHTEWHRIVVFKKLADIVNQYVKKGSRLYVEGKISTRKYRDNNQQERYIVEVVANNILLLDGKQLKDNNASEEANGNKFNDDIPF